MKETRVTLWDWCRTFFFQATFVQSKGTLLNLRLLINYPYVAHETYTVINYILLSFKWDNKQRNWFMLTKTRTCKKCQCRVGRLGTDACQPATSVTTAADSLTRWSIDPWISVIFAFILRFFWMMHLTFYCIFNFRNLMSNLNLISFLWQYMSSFFFKICKFVSFFSWFKQALSLILITLFFNKRCLFK